jgi:NADH-quinone oxidoreductase subunit C
MPEKGTIVDEKGLGYTLTVDRKDLLKAAIGLKAAGFDLFLFVSGVDYPDRIKLVYRIYSTKRRNKVGVIIKTEVPKSDPVIDSLVPLWSAANWHERETYDLFGVIFKGHPDLRRIFMPQDWIGHPLRKDYSDDHMLVMDDGIKEKPAAKDEPTAVHKENTGRSDKNE